MPTAIKTIVEGSGTTPVLSVAAISLVAAAVNDCSILPPPNTKAPPLIFVRAIEKLMEVASICGANVPPTTVPFVTEMIPPVEEFSVPLSTLRLEAKLTSKSSVFPGAGP